MTVKAHEEKGNIMTSIMTDHHLLRKVVSDVTNDASRLGMSLETIGEMDETILQVECDCCGLKEDCTREYISRIRNSFSGKWVCGLCSEAVKERINHGTVAIEEAVNNHRDFVQEFNTTTRLNPKLSLTWTMRDIVKRSGQKGNNLSGGMKITRSTSCVPRINLDLNKRNISS